MSAKSMWRLHKQLHWVVGPLPAKCPGMPEDSSGSGHDQDFMSFVHSTLNAQNTKMDNLLTNQTALETKLESIEHRVTINTTVTTELSRDTRV